MPHAEDAVEHAVRSFAAAMTGEIAHELGNRLATMRETVGLLEDLARAGKAGAGGTARAHASLDEQVGRALNIVRALGRLSGALGSAAGSFDAGAAIGDLLGMTGRWALRHSQRVECSLSEDLPAAAGNPALFLCLAHRLLVRCVEAQPHGGSVLVRLERAGDRIVVRLIPAAATATGATPTASQEATDRELALRLGAGLIIEGGGVLTIVLAAARP